MGAVGLEVEVARVGVDGAGRPKGRTNETGPCMFAPSYIIILMCIVAYWWFGQSGNRSPVIVGFLL